MPDDADDFLLQTVTTRTCTVAKLISDLPPGVGQKVTDALAQPARLVTTKNIHEYLSRKLPDHPIHADTVGKHRRGVCSCKR